MEKVAVILNVRNNVGNNIIEKLVNSKITVIGVINTKPEGSLNFVSENNKRMNLVECDLLDSDMLSNLFKFVMEKYKCIDFLLNIINCDSDSLISTANFEEMKHIIDSNVLVMVANVRLAAEFMMKNNKGHILNVIEYCNPEVLQNSIYATATSAISSINDILRHEFRYLKANIKTTNIQVDINFHNTSKSKSSLQNHNLNGKDLANVIYKIMKTAEHVHIYDVHLEYSDETF